MSGEGVARALEVRRALGMFLEQARAPVIVVDPSGHLVSANDAALAQYGYGLDEIVHMRIHDLMALPRPELPLDLQRAYDGDAASLGRRAHRRKDGSIVWVVPVAGPVNVLGERLIVSVLQDVSALVSAEEKAHLEQSRLELVWETSVERFGGSFALLDSERRIVRVNRLLLQWLRKTEDQAVGRRCDELFIRLCAQQPCPHVLALAERRRVVREVDTFQDRLLRVEVAPAPPNDTGIALVHVAYDLTEQRETRSRLVAADRLVSLGRVAAGVAHEVNNPAAFLTLALPIVRERVAQGRYAEASTLVDESIAATMQITEVMRELGGLSRDRPRAVVDLGALANGAIRIASYEAQTRARVERLFEEGVLAEIRGARIVQVLLNLILNAAQALPDGEPERHRIEVVVRRSGDRALLEVSDTGPGVPEGIGDRIFEPFFTTRAARGGTGLGLWLSRTIVEEEGGTLTWRNRPEGGAVFTVSLPLARERDSGTTRAQPQAG
jgi:PAS domain S-box-containing protein